MDKQTEVKAISKEVTVLNTVTGEEKVIIVGRLSARSGGALVKRVSKVFQLANKDQDFRVALNGLITLIEQSATEEATNPNVIWQGLIGTMLASDILYQEFLGFLGDALNIESDELDEIDLENIIELAIAIKGVNDFKLIKTLLSNFQKGAKQKVQKKATPGKSKK